MSRFEVTTSALGPVGGRLAGLGDDLGGARAALTGVSGAGGAADSGAFAGATSGLVDGFGAMLVTMDLAASALGQTVSASGASYAATDSNAFGGP